MARSTWKTLGFFAALLLTLLVGGVIAVVLGLAKWVDFSGGR